MCALFMFVCAPPDLRAISHFATPRRANSASFTTAGGKARIASSTLPSLALGVSAGYRLVLGTGDLAAAFGADGSAYGLDARAEVSGALAVGLSYALRLGYERNGLAFTGGAGALAEGTDGADSALRVQLLAGWQIQ